MSKFYKYKLLFLFWVIIFISLNTYHKDAFGMRGDRFKKGGAYIGTNPSMSSDGAKIVFGSTRYGLGDICIVNSNGDNWMRLTYTAEYEGEPSFSPDGNRIVFVSERDGNGEIYIMNRDGSKQSRLTYYKHYDGNPSFSPDGSKIVFARNVSDLKTEGLKSHIFIMNVDGTEVKRITYGDAWYSGPKFSNDCRKLLFKSVWQGEQDATGIGMINVDGTGEIRLRKCFCYYPSFSPDDNKILFVADWRDEGEYELWTMTLDSHVLTKILHQDNLDIYYPSYVHNGAKILFLNEVNERGGQICTINEDGNNLSIITTSY